MRVDDLLNLPELALQVRVRGRVDRPIRWVHTIEIKAPGRSCAAARSSRSRGSATPWRSSRGASTMHWTAESPTSASASPEPRRSCA
ncbi:PucR family transcriptional regulator ligand-binding domain-containing protein [Saccharopolyspora pogona]|uniref:PucR family transcriptional regulator ligand-binding domain-containing protein n=1 Tax=Saccharopolyspora pogona TaxID=333966 RepID=UPI001CC24CC1|nr:PucR family transcriptional regulator ligand-binding domain-containing protein [Saccharopolyspora pogona]